MARHNEILNKFKTIQPVFKFTNKDHKEVVSEHARNPEIGPADTRGQLIMNALPADEDHGEGERHLQRSEAHGCG